MKLQFVNVRNDNSNSLNMKRVNAVYSVHYK